jgi:hypothetical protein
MPGAGDDKPAFTAYSYSNALNAAAEADAEAALFGTDEAPAVGSAEWEAALASAAQRLADEDSDDSPPLITPAAAILTSADEDGGSSSISVSEQGEVLFRYAASPSNAAGTTTGLLLPSGSGHKANSSPSTLRPSPAVEEEIQQLRQALTRSELRAMSLEKRMAQLQRRNHQAQHKARVSKLESQVQNLEYQIVCCCRKQVELSGRKFHVGSPLVAFIFLARMLSLSFTVTL